MIVSAVQTGLQAIGLQVRAVACDLHPVLTTRPPSLPLPAPPLRLLQSLNALDRH